MKKSFIFWPLVKAEPKMKLTLPIVQNIHRIGKLKIGREQAIFEMSNFVTYSAELNATMHRCHFPEQFSPSACNPLKELASIHFFILYPMLLLCGHASAEKATQHFPYLGVHSSLDSF